MAHALPAPRTSKARRAAEIAARALTAIGLGYLTAALSTAVLARLLPGPVVEATMAATLSAFAVYAAVAVWAFADPKVLRVWAGLLVFAACAGAVLWLSLRLEPRL